MQVYAHGIALLTALRFEFVNGFHDSANAVAVGTKFSPTWVKIAVAIALGMGTMIGWNEHGRREDQGAAKAKTGTPVSGLSGRGR